MFLEKDHIKSVKYGWIEVVCGSMFSGKTEELIRRLNRARIAKQKVEIFKPAIDTRYDDDDVVFVVAVAVVDVVVVVFAPGRLPKTLRLACFEGI